MSSHKSSHKSSACPWSDHSSASSSTPRRPPRRRRQNLKTGRACEEHLRGNFTSFFWDAHVEIQRDMMPSDHSFSSNGSFYTDSEAEGEDRYCNVKDSLGTAGDSGVASTCSSASDRSSPLYTQILSTTRVPPLRRARSSSTISVVRSTITTKTGERQSQRRFLPKERRRGERRESPAPRKTPQRGTYQSASFHTSRASAKSVANTEGRYNVKKRKIYEDCNVSSTQPVSSKRPCCWECFEATVEKERVNAGFPARTAYLPEPMAENHYENISFDACDADTSAWARGGNRSRMSAGPAVPPRQSMRKTRELEQEEEAMSSESDTYARLCSIEFSKLHAADSLFSQERLASLQKKIERLLLVKSEIDLSEKNLDEGEFAKATNQVVYRIERRLRAIEAYSQPQFKKITAELIALLASAEKKQKSKMDSFKRGIARAVKVIF